MADTFARMKQLVGTTAEWAANDIVLGEGEIGVERIGVSDHRAKCGDGVKTWSQLPYLSGTAAAVDAQVAAASAHALTATTQAGIATAKAAEADASAIAAAASYDNFDDRYLGAKSSPPTVDNDGNALMIGAVYWDTGSSQMYAWNGTAWNSTLGGLSSVNVSYTPAGAGAVNRTAQAKLREIVSRADTGGTDKELIRFKAGGTSSDTVIVNSSVNDTANNLSAAAILGGGSTWDENYIGFGKNRVTFTTTGTSFTWPFLPTGNDLANLRVFKYTSSRSSSALTSPSGYTASISGSQVNITLAVALTTGERLVVEDRAAKVAFNPNPPNYEVAPSYSWIGGGYDNIVLNGVMQSVQGAHHRVLGGDHGSIYGGSYSIINAGSYGAILGGTGNEIGSPGGTGGGVASVVAGGIRNLASGGTSSILGGQSNTASGTQTAICGGTNNLVSGTASFASGRNNTVTGSDSFAFGDGNTTSGNYSAVWGYQNVVSHNHSYAKGLKATTGWRGQDVRFGYRDGVQPNPQREHFYIDLSLYSTGTSSALLQLLDGTTSITPPVNTGWKCTLNVVARGGNLKTAMYELNFLVQRGASTAEIVGSVDVFKRVDPGMGTSTNEASVSVAINGSNALEVTVQPRLDVSVGTKWAGVLEVLEVN